MDPVRSHDFPHLFTGGYVPEFGPCIWCGVSPRAMSHFGWDKCSKAPAPKVGTVPPYERYCPDCRGECTGACWANPAENNYVANSSNILFEADALTGNGGDRNDSYDHPYPNFSKIGAVWSALFGIEVTPRMVAQAMIGMKLVRDCHKPKRDNIVDIAGYARCIERLEEWTEDD